MRHNHSAVGGILVSDRFCLNPEYLHFQPGQTQLQFNRFFKDHVPFRFLIPVFLIWLPITAYLIVNTFDLFSTDWAFKSQGVTATAQVANCQPIGKREDKQILTISYTYTVEGVMYQRENGAVRSSKPCQQLSTELRILYLLSNPAESRLYATTSSRAKVNQNGDSLVLCALAILAVILLEQEVVRHIVARRDLYLLRKRGKLLPGEIVHIDRKLNANRNSSRCEVEVTYRFLSPERELLRRTQMQRRDDLHDSNLPVRGTLVNVLYLNNDVHVML